MLPAEGYGGDYPRLPSSWSTTISKTIENGDGDKEVVTEKVKFTYLAATRAWYEDHARSPQATRFTRTDWRRLLTIAPLVDQYHRQPNARLAGELRLQESLLGATLMDRQRMRMRVAAAGPTAPGGSGGKVADFAAERRARMQQPPEE